MASKAMLVGGRHGECPGVLGVELPVLHAEELWPRRRAQASR